MSKKDEKPQQPLATQPQHETALVKPMTPQEARQMYGDLGTEDYSVPRITILQGLSPEVADGLGKPGNLFIKGLNRELGKELEIIPLLRSRSRIMWKPMTEGGGITCQAFDGHHGQGTPGGNCDMCHLKEWNGAEQPACDLYENVVMVIRNDEDWIPMSFSGSRTKLKAMKDLNTLFMAELLKQRPLFMKSYVIRVVEKTSKANLKFFTCRMFPGNDNRTLPEVEIKRAQAIYDAIKTKNLKIEQEEAGQGEVNSEL